MKEKVVIDKTNVWLLVSILFFAVTKIVALICAAVIALQGNLWVGSALFIGAIVFRITWTFTPTMDEMAIVKDKEILLLRKRNAELEAMITRNA